MKKCFIKYIFNLCFC